MTNENLRELIAALPADPTPEAPADEQLQQILADLANRPVPLSSLHRLWTLGELSAQVALAYFALWMRGWYADAETRKRQVLETNLRVALKMFRHLGYLRGAMTKLGQAAGNFPLLIPDQVAETLDKLHFDAPPMHYQLIREVLFNELGREPEELFAAFDKEAFAAASLGQVHRATLKSGEQVAVKIQYPGIARTIDADFRNLGALLFPMRLGKDWDYTKGQFDEIHRMLNQEVDYRQEAESMRQARNLFRPDEGIVIPHVHADYSTARVLTTGFLPGLHLPAFLAANPTQAQRNEFGTKIYRAHFRMYYAYMSHADPSAGNYIFMDDGRLGLIDFGCVQHYNAGERQILQVSQEIIDDPNSPAFDQLLMLVMGIGPEDPEREIYHTMIHQSRDWMMEAMQGGPFDFGDEGHLKRGLEWFSGAIRGRHTRSHPMYVYFNRSVFAIKALLYRLRAQVDVREIYNRESKPK